MPFTYLPHGLTYKTKAKRRKFLKRKNPADRSAGFETQRQIHLWLFVQKKEPREPNVHGALSHSSYSFTVRKNLQISYTCPGETVEKIGELIGESGLNRDS